MDFKNMLLLAQDGDENALAAVFAMYKPLLLKEAIVDSVFDEDLYSELCLIFLKCIKKFRV